MLPNTAAASTNGSIDKVHKAPQITQQEQYAFESLSTEYKHNRSYQYHGYPAFSRHIASEHDFFTLRRFAPTQVRCILRLQNQIAALGAELQAWDDYAMKHDHGNKPELADSSQMMDDIWPEREEILDRLLPLIQRYNNLVLSFGQIRAKPTASRHHHQNLRNWFTTYPTSVVPEERHADGNEGDMFVVVTKSKTPLALVVEKFAWLRSVFKTGKRSDHDDSELAAYASDGAIDTATTAIIMLIGFGLLFGPVWWLNSVARHSSQLGIVTAFSGGFTLWMWLAAGNRPFEILASTAAYTAVLMIYRQLS